MSITDAPTTNPVNFGSLAAVDYLAAQAPVTDPEDHEQEVISRAIKAAYRVSSPVVHLPLTADLNLFTSIVMDAEVNAERHAEDSETFDARTRSTARTAARVLAAYTA